MHDKKHEIPVHWKQYIIKKRKYWDLNPQKYDLETNGLTLYTTASQYKGFAQLVLLYYSCTLDLPFLKCIDPYNIYNDSEKNKLQPYMFLLYLFVMSK
jgi:hypothetical protein